MENVIYYEVPSLPLTSYTTFINDFFKYFLEPLSLTMVIVALIFSFLLAFQNNYILRKSLKSSGGG